ncbi:hypothetical protein [Ferrimonas marina]|uniref:TrbC/VIRB2 family protein n=1 Tax=Ferrimonas marina TaxID=299255 RepID=A0A1M5TIA8_9GAMM|nr:hypothetical protein [Ferrimonas marina]SHH50418.1 hypothetical protein SAMN02745129_2155 [Ferrimonas marina]
MKNKFNLFCTWLFVAMVMPAANAAGLESIAENGKKAADEFQNLAVSVVYLAGIVVFGLGCFYLYKDQKEEGRGHGKTGFVALLVGAALLAMPSLVDIFAGTVVGGDANFDFSN